MYSTRFLERDIPSGPWPFIFSLRFICRADMTPCSGETHSAGGIVTSDSCAISQTFDGGLEQ